MKRQRPYSRRKKLIKPGLQLRMTAQFAGIAALALLLQALLISARLTQLAAEMPMGGSQLQERVPSMVLETLAYSCLLLLPLTLGVGVMITFRFAGPVFRFERHLAAVARGEAVDSCRIRKHDELHDLCAVLNSAIEQLQSEGKRGGAEDLEAQRSSGRAA